MYSCCSIIAAIPYAKPPIGDLRFAKPQPFGNFTNGYLNGTEFGSICAQYDKNKQVGTEDCLFLNIFAPADTTTSKVRKIESFLPNMLYK